MKLTISSLASLLSELTWRPDLAHRPQEGTHP